MNIDGTNIREITGLPLNPDLGFPLWTADGKKFAFTNTTESDIELWVCDIPEMKASKIADHLNMVFGRSISWLRDNSTLIYSVIDPGRGNRPERSPVPGGPVIQENLGKEGEIRLMKQSLNFMQSHSLCYGTETEASVWGRQQ
jgi:hypothetical protein